MSSTAPRIFCWRSRGRALTRSKRALALPTGPGPLGGGAGDKEFVGGNGKHSRQVGEVIGAEGAGAAFPAGEGLLRNPRFYRDLGLGEIGVRCTGAEAINPAYINGFLGHEYLNTLQPGEKLSIADLKKTHAKCQPREREG